MTLTAPTATSDVPAAAPAPRSVPPRVRAVLAVLAAAVASAPSLAGLVADLRYGAPTGDLVVVPVVAAVMLDAVVRSRRTVWAGRLGHGDLVAAAALGTATLVLLLAPGQTTNTHSLGRLDLLAHPIALASCAVLLLGLRVLAVAVVPLSFGLLVWPGPVTWLDVRGVAPLTDATYQVSGHLAQWLGTAQMVDIGAENTLRVGSGEHAFEISVAPACSGVAGMTAYLVVAGAVLALTRGRLRSRAGWMLCGLVAVWLANVVRVVGLAAAGRVWGADVALDLLHPVAGLALDALVVVLLVASLSRFGLRWAAPTRADPGASAATTVPGFVIPTTPPSLRSVGARVLLAGSLAAVLFVADLHAAGPERGLQTAVPRRVVTLADVAGVGPGARLLGRQDWSKAYFGPDSVWNRYRVTSDGAGGGRSVWLDSLVVGDVRALRAHDVLSCYGFHGARVVDGGTHRVAGRFLARLVVVEQPDGERWQSLYWEWPVSTADGVRYERVAIFVGGVPTPVPGGAAGNRAAGSATTVDPGMARALLEAANRVAGRVLDVRTAEAVAR